MSRWNQITLIHKDVRMVLSIAITALVIICSALLLPAPSRGAKIATIKVGLVTDTGGLTEYGYNWLSHQGLLRAETDLDVEGTLYQSTSEADFAIHLNQCVLDGNELCISVGFFTSNAIQAAATANPTVKFAILDVELDSYPSNLRGITFNSNEPAYLAGVLAGLMSQSRIAGDIGGMEIPAVTDFTLPFRNGFLRARSNGSVLLRYTNDFINPALGAYVAQELISDGADVIFSPAGSTGEGAVLSATQSGTWGIGVDVDYYYGVFEGGAVAGSDRLLTSVLKKLDNGVYFTIQDVLSNAFTSGTVEYDLLEGGVGLAPYHETEAQIPAAVKVYLEEVRLDILAGSIDVNRFPDYHEYFALLSK